MGKTARDWSMLDMRALWVGVGLTALTLVSAVPLGPGPFTPLTLLGGTLYVSGLLLLGMPILILKRRGDVARGDSFVNTETLVTTGLYGLVRHPQYLGWMTLAASVPLYTQHAVSLALAVMAVSATAWGFRDLDRFETEVFGEEYRRYAERVPGFNLALGVARALRRGSRP